MACCIDRKGLPVYCIETFKDEYTKDIDFDIKALKHLVDDFEFTNHPHRHDFYNLLFICNGTGNHTIDFVTYPVKPFSVFFLSPGQVHSWDLSQDTEGYSIFFKPDFYILGYNHHKLLDFPFFHTMNSDPTLYLDMHQAPVVQSAITEIYQENRTNEIGRAGVIRAFLDVLLIRLSRLYQRMQPQQEPLHVTARIRELETLIDKNFREKKQPADYAGMMCLSVKHLNSLCKRGLNKTISQMIQERVILESKRLLLHSTLTISEVAYSLGYTDNSYFARFFRSKMDCSPDQYRQEGH